MLLTVFFAASFLAFTVNAATVPSADQCTASLMKCQGEAWKKHEKDLMDEKDKKCEKANGKSVFFRFLKCEKDTYKRNFKGPTSTWNADDKKGLGAWMKDSGLDEKDLDKWDAYLKDISECTGKEQCFNREAFNQISQSCQNIWMECKDGKPRDASNKEVCASVLWDCEFDLFPKWEDKLMPKKDDMKCEKADGRSVWQEFMDCQYDNYKELYTTDEAGWSDSVKPEFEKKVKAEHPDAKNVDEWFSYVQELTKCMHEKKCFDNKAFEGIAEKCTKIWAKCAA